MGLWSELGSGCPVWVSKGSTVRSLEPYPRLELSLSGTWYSAPLGLDLCVKHQIIYTSYLLNTLSNLICMRASGTAEQRSGVDETCNPGRMQPPGVAPSARRTPWLGVYFGGRWGWPCCFSKNRSRRWEPSYLSSWKPCHEDQTNLDPGQVLPEKTLYSCLQVSPAFYQ